MHNFDLTDKHIIEYKQQHNDADIKELHCAFPKVDESHIKEIINNIKMLNKESH